VDLGLIYEVGVDQDEQVSILMTLTTPGCPLGGWFIERVTEAVATGLKIDEEQVKVRITFDPPWSQELMTNEVKEQLGME
jgi:metal-sulfur cluster biosynthetic enzyme